MRRLPFPCNVLVSLLIGAGAGKGAFNGPGFVSWDAGLMKNFAINERAHFQFHAEFFNVLNHTNLGNPNQTANSQTFGAIQSANDPRIGQLALKLIF